MKWTHAASTLAGSILGAALVLAAMAHATPTRPAAGSDIAVADQLSTPGSNEWNQAREPADAWEALRNEHGHVGPWNVFGYRAARAALRELGATWGLHELDVVYHTPLAMPFSCAADGLTVGTGNSLGRLNVRLAETASPALVQVQATRQDGTGPVLLITPAAGFRSRLRGISPSTMDAIARSCWDAPEQEILVITAIGR